MVTSFSLWLSMALPLPDKIHNFYLMVQSAWAFWRTLPEIDVSHFRSTEDANYPLETPLRRLMQLSLPVLLQFCLALSPLPSSL